MSEGGAPARHIRLHQPRLAELIADILRRRILDGTFGEGDVLPKQEELVEEFRVSQPSIREALGILETEGLVTVRRGNVGGAVVHRPRPEHAAHMLALVLRSRRVSVGDVGIARAKIEPACAGMCAARADRAAAVLPRLRAVHADARGLVDDGVALASVARRFHEELVACCGNATMIIVVGALESLWSADERDWAAQVTEAGSFPADDYRRRRLDEHDAIIDLIEAGDVDGVVALMSHHIDDGTLYRQSSHLTAPVVGLSWHRFLASAGGG